MTKCKGCGITLQNKDKNGLGYVEDINSDICRRCFRLSHYGEYKTVSLDNSDYKKIIKSIPDDSLVVYICDILSLDIRADGSIGEYIYMDMPGKTCPLVKPNTPKDCHIKMNGKEVYKFVVKVLPQYIDKCLEEAGMTPEDVDYLIPHQANQRIIEAMQQRLQYPDEKVISNIKYYGNTSAASVPIALAEGVEKGNIKLGTTAILCGFGAGMTWGAAIVRLREGIC